MKKLEGVLKKVRETEYKKGIVYENSDGNLCKTLNIFYILAGAFALLMNLFFLISYIFVYIDKNDNIYKVISVSVLSIFLIAGFILGKTKLIYTPFALNILSACGLIVIFAKECEKVAFREYSSVFYWRHLIPLLIVLITSVWIFIIKLRAKIKTNRLYKKVESDIYKEFCSQNAEFTEEEWQEFIKNYDPDKIKNEE